jgi:hypothetical protein
MLRIPFAEAREWMKYPWILLNAEEDQRHLSRLSAEVKIDGHWAIRQWVLDDQERNQTAEIVGPSAKDAKVSK